MRPPHERNYRMADAKKEKRSAGPTFFGKFVVFLAFKDIKKEEAL